MDAAVWSANFERVLLADPPCESFKESTNSCCFRGSLDLRHLIVFNRDAHRRRETDRHPNLFRPDWHHLIEHIDTVGPDRIHRRIDAVRKRTIVAVATPIGIGFAATPRRSDPAFQMRAVRVGY